MVLRLACVLRVLWPREDKAGTRHPDQVAIRAVFVYPQRDNRALPPTHRLLSDLGHEVTTTESLSDYRSAKAKDSGAAMRVFLGLLNEGILMTQRGLGACSLAMTDEDVDRFINALARVNARA